MTITEITSFIKDIFQIIFFISVSIVTILTYRKAKETLLQPIKTEIFKEQLKLFSDILNEFNGKDEIELRESFGFEKIAFVNTWDLYRAYTSHFFDIKGEIKQPYDDKDFPGGNFDLDAKITLVDDFVISQKEEEDIKSDTRTKAAIWGEHKVQMLKLPKEFFKKQNDFQRILDSPLAPKQLVELITEYLKIVNNNLTILKKLLTQCAQEMPEKYPNTDELKKAAFYWIHHKYMGEFEHLSPQAKKINDFLRSYFTVETILE